MSYLEQSLLPAPEGHGTGLLTAEVIVRKVPILQELVGMSPRQGRVVHVAKALGATGSSASTLQVVAEYSGIHPSPVRRWSTGLRLSGRSIPRRVGGGSTLPPRKVRS